jgi:hypothetical protein
MFDRRPLGCPPVTDITHWVFDIRWMSYSQVHKSCFDRLEEALAAAPFGVDGDTLELDSPGAASDVGEVGGLNVRDAIDLDLDDVSSELDHTCVLDPEIGNADSVGDGMAACDHFPEKAQRRRSGFRWRAEAASKAKACQSAQTMAKCKNTKGAMNAKDTQGTLLHSFGN